MNEQRLTEKPWESEYLRDLEEKGWNSIAKSHPKVDKIERAHRVAWYMFDEMMKKNFTSNIPEFIEGLHDYLLRMMPITIKEEYVAFERFLKILDLESQKRSDEVLKRYTNKLIFLTWVLVGLGLITIIPLGIEFVKWLHSLFR